MLLFSMAIGLLGLAGMDFADTITLKSGRVIQGTYLGGTARTVRVEIGNQIQTLYVNDVARIEFSGPAPTQVSVTEQPAEAPSTPVRTTGTANPRVAAVPQVVSVPRANPSDSHKARLTELWQRRRVLQDGLTSRRDRAGYVWKTSKDARATLS
jgi:hypothetical protein